MAQSYFLTSSIVHNNEKKGTIPFMQTEQQVYINQVQCLKQDIINNAEIQSESDLVDSEIIASWVRSHDYGVDINQSPVICPKVSKKRFEKLFLQNKRLIESALASVQQVELLLHANYDFFLFDPNGVFLLMIPGENNNLYNDIDLQPGVIWTEETIGTTSMTLAPILKRPVQLCGSENYLNYFSAVSSSSAPILDADDHLIGTISIGTINLTLVNSLLLSLITSIATSIQQKLQNNTNQPTEDEASFEYKMNEYLFGKSTANIADLLILSNYQFSAEDAYTICVMATNNVTDTAKWNSIKRFSKEFLQREYPDALMISNPPLATLIVPTHKKEFPCELFLTELERQVQVTATFGQSASHPLRELRKCCDEARISVSYLRLMGTDVKVQSFLSLGVFTPLFAQDLENVKIFCRHTLNPLFDHDVHDESSLLTTLKVLVNSNFNLRETAKKLYIHINTLYYRIDKIEHLLHVNLTTMSTRVNLYTAIQAWTLLDMSGLLE